MIVCVPIAGLANRIRCVNSAIELGKASNQKVKVYWFRDSFLNAGFRDLFEPVPGIEVIDEPFKFKVLYCEPDYLGKRDAFVTKTYHKLFFNEVFYRDDLRVNLYEFKTPPEEMLKRVSKARNTLIISDFSFYPITKNYLNPTESITKTIKEVTSNFGDFTIGLHIRRTDNEIAIKASTDDLFFNRIDKEISEKKNCKFFLATDSGELKQKLAKQYGDRILTYNSSLKRDDVEGIKHAMVELFILSKTNKIIGSYGSSFSEIAAFIGNTQLVYP